MGSGRFRRGWELTKRSWGLLRSNPALFRFPIFGALATLVPVVLLVFPGLYLVDKEDTVPGAVLIAVGLYIAAFITIYFGVALAAAADALFKGRRDPGAEGYAVARSRLRPIAGWALISAILGGIFAALESQRGIAQIVGRLFGAAWGLITFLAVPVIAIEGTGPVETLKRSTHLFKERWAGQLTGNIAIGGIVGLLGTLPAMLVIALGVYLWMDDPNGDGIALGAVLVAIGAVVFAVSLLLQRALRGVFGVALYRYAAEGTADGGFTAEELDSAVGTRH